MIKVSDYIVQRLREWDVEHVFLVTGGGAMHLNDSIGRAKGLRYICNHHEQAAAMAAEGYARIAGKPGVLNVTTGPGGINALNGVFGAWTDSIPMLIFSGQVKRETCMAAAGISGLRQLGDQEVDIIKMVKSITKYAELVDEPRTIACHLEKAWRLASAGRPGPCWLDIPVDVQSSMIDESSLQHYDPSEDDCPRDIAQISALCHEVIARIDRARRPVILAGSGVRIAGALTEFEDVIRALGIPVTTAWTHDLIASDDELFCGRPGTIGERAGNFTVQNADLVLVLGSRMNIRQVSYNWRSFASAAYKIQVDVDPAELCKPTVKPDFPICCDLKIFLAEMRRQLLQRVPVEGNPRHAKWLAWCKERQLRYPAIAGKHNTERPINPYHFVDRLFDMLAEDDVVVCGNATACIVPYQVARLKKGQRLISNSGCASMGHDLPAALGAAVARGNKRVICLAGDGSIQFNIQELQTIAHHRLPVKIFVLNNGGYLSIRTTQSAFFERLMGEGPSSGVSFPDMVKIAGAYGISSSRIESASCIPSILEGLDAPGPFLWEVCLDPKQEFEPRIKSRQLPDGNIVSPALEDMYPFLDPEEAKSNMIAED